MRHTTDFCFVYITTPSMDLAQRIGKALVQERLVACVNILPQMASIYEWKGEVRTDSEVVMILKTREALLPKAEERVRVLHEYECPCFVVLPLNGGSEAYLDWLSSQTSSLP